MNFYEEVVKRKENILADLTNLLKIESTKDLNSASDGKPMGKNIAEALDYMLILSSQQGFKVTNHEGYYGYADFGDANTEDHIAILGHLDVVPATGEWTSPPFEPTIREGKLFARGAIDDKGPTLAAFYALKLIKELQFPLKHNIRIIFGTDEESGMSCLRKYREVEQPPIAGFAPDATFPIIHAEKGQINAKLVMNHPTLSGMSTATLTLDTFTAGTRPNMVPETATATLSGAEDLLALEEKYHAYLDQSGFLGSATNDGETLTLRIKGTSAHSMEPFKGVNAATSLARFLRTLSLDPNGGNYVSFIGDLCFEDHLGKNLGIAHTDEITGPLTMNPAIFSYQKDQEASVHVNIRYPVTAKFETIEANIAATIEGYSFTMGEIRNKNPHYVAEDTPMIQALQSAYQEETGEEATLLSSGGNTYASLLPNCVAYGAVFPGKEMTAHQKDEYIEIDDLLKATAIYARAIYYLANMETAE